jgi:Ni/Co efflux regulator RcnB
MGAGGDCAAADKEIAMNNKLIAFAGSLLLLGATATTAFAQEAVNQYPEPLHANGDADFDGVPNAEDPVDDRFDAAGNPVRFEPGEALPADAIGNNTRVHGTVGGYLKRPAAGQSWHRLGNNYYLVDAGGVVLDAVYNLRD